MNGFLGHSIKCHPYIHRVCFCTQPILECRVSYITYIRTTFLYNELTGGFIDLYLIEVLPPFKNKGMAFRFEGGIFSLNTRKLYIILSDFNI